MNLHQAVHYTGITLIYTLTTITLVKENFNMGICQQGPKSSPKFIIKKIISKKKKKVRNKAPCHVPRKSKEKRGGKGNVLRK